MTKSLLIATVVTLLVLSIPTLAQESGGEVHNPEQRIAALKQKASSGNAKSQVDLGVAYASGDGLPADEGEAVRWFRKAAEQGDMAGEYSLGEMYATGRGVPLDYVEALKWLRKSAGQGDPRGEFNLAAMYANGNGVLKDDAEAAKWVRKSAEQGFAPGQFGLAVMYAHGRGVTQDEAEAVRWYRRAIDQGDIPALNNLAFLLATSKDVHVRNPIEAIATALKAVETDGQNSTYLDTLATAYYEAGQYEKASENEKKALVLSPDKALYQEALKKYLDTAAKH